MPPVTHPGLTTGITLARYLCISDRWDFIIAGDGSASGWSAAGGFGSHIYSKDPAGCIPIYGGMSNLTVALSEMYAIIHPLLFLDGMLELNDWKPKVWCISDSQTIVNVCKGAAVPKRNLGLWATLGSLKERFDLNFVYLPRLTIPANAYGDAIGTNIRLAMEGLGNVG